MADKFEKVTKNKKKVEQPSHKLTDPAVVDVLYSANLAEDLQKENQEPSTSSDQTPEQPLPKYTRSEILPRIAVSQRWHPELNANYSKICCQAHLNVDENGKKIPTSVRILFCLTLLTIGITDFFLENGFVSSSSKMWSKRL